MSEPPHHLLLRENPDWFNLSGAGSFTQAVQVTRVFVLHYVSSYNSIIIYKHKFIGKTAVKTTW